MQTQRHFAASALLLALAGAGAGATAARADIAVNLNGQPLATSVSPLQVNGRTLVPMRDIFEALGAQLSWNPVAQTITAQKDLTRIQLAINNRDALVNGRNVRLEQPAALVNGRTFVPLRFVAEATGAQVDWNGTLQLISIRSTDSGNNGVIVAQNSLAQPNQPIGELPPIYQMPPHNNEPTGGTQVAAARTLSIPDGAVLPVQIDQNLSSATARVGQTFTASVVSRRLGDSEFPAGTKIEGRVIEARPSQNNQPGVLDLEWTSAVLPDGERVPLRGELISLDASNVQMTGGRIVARGARRDDRLKVIGVGAGAGFVLGRVIGGNSTLTTILGAAGGYLFGRARDRKAEEASLAANTTLGVRLNERVRYTDTSDYFPARAQFLRVSTDGENRFDPDYFGFDTSTAVPLEGADAAAYGDYNYSNRLPAPADESPLNVGDIYPEDGATPGNGNVGGRRGNRPGANRPNANRPGGRRGGNGGLNGGFDNQTVAGYRQISIPSGAVVPVTLDREISSATARVGQEFTATLVSQNLGDSEFPAGSKIAGRVIEARPQEGAEPGTLDLEFQTAILPDGTRVPLRGELISLDDKAVQTQNGRIVARAGKGKNDRLKVIGIGTAAGFVVGRVLKKDGLLPSLLG
ncbi:MAG TPA: copper amine oxidase N-terminal domain-containing protein, partial [Abditibacterium sp.]